MHCKDVSVLEADFPLTEEGIREGLVGHRAYVRAQYVVMSKDGEYAIAEQHLSEGKTLFRTVESVDVIALPDETVFVDLPTVDVLNEPDRARIQKEYPGKTVIVQGMFSHVSFVKDVEYKTLRIVDSVPPHPSKTEVLVKKALDSGLIEIPIVTENFIIDYKDLLPEVKTEAVVFPCVVSGLEAEIPHYYLDTFPDIKHEVTLIGCETSRRIFMELYGRDVPMLNTCPKDLYPKDGVKTIARCCKIKKDHVMEGNVALVPWGATVPEIMEAIKALFS